MSEIVQSLCKTDSFLGVLPLIYTGLSSYLAKQTEILFVYDLYFSWDLGMSMQLLGKRDWRLFWYITSVYLLNILRAFCRRLAKYFSDVLALPSVLPNVNCDYLILLAGHCTNARMCCWLCNRYQSKGFSVIRAVVNLSEKSRFIALGNWTFLFILLRF